MARCCLVQRMCNGDDVVSPKTNDIVSLIFLRKWITRWPTHPRMLKLEILRPLHILSPHMHFELAYRCSYWDILESVFNFQHMEILVELNSLFLKFFCNITWFNETRHWRSCKYLDLLVIQATCTFDYLWFLA